MVEWRFSSGFSGCFNFKEDVGHINIGRSKNIFVKNFLV